MAADNDNNPDSRRSLYERFRRGVGGKDTDFFDEDDLIDIYDYANDVNDDFVKMEVLFEGASRYPASEQLRERRRYLYYYLGNDDAVNTLLERGDSSSVLSRLLALRRKSDRGESTVDGLEAILATLDHKLDDEEIIQFVGEASIPENYEWLLANTERLRGMVEYQPTFLYELSATAMEKGDADTAVKMAEELTMLEPFNVEFWELLAEAAFNSADYDAALNAVDYALAVAPDSTKSQKLKAWSLFRKNGYSPEAIDILKRLAADEDFDTLSMQTLALMLVKAGREEEALTLSNAFLEKNPDDRPVLDYVFVLEPESVARRLKAIEFEPEIEGNEAFWVDWASKHAVNDRHNVAAELLLHAREKKALADNMPFLYEELYRAGRYADVLELFDSDTAASSKGVGTYLAVIMSLIRMDRKEEAMQKVTSLLGGDSMFLRGAFSRMFAITYAKGGQVLLRSIAEALTAPEPLPTDEYDPFAL